MKPEQIDATTVRDADVLVVRTRTKVNEALLRGSRVRMVCTATIGYDHIDTSYCEANGIRWMSCPGCNAQAVCDYIEEAIKEITNHQSPITNYQSPITNPMPVIGIVGVGHVGSKVAQMAERKGYKVLLNDPPKGIGIPLDELVRQCDIITFHVPLITNHQSPITNHQYPTYHLCDEALLNQCKPNALIINAARGGVVDEQALLRSGHPYILDTWENEPEIDAEVVEKALLASMHIAGYSVAGKRNATQMCLDAVAQAFGLPCLPIDERHPSILFPEGDTSPGWLGRISAQLKAHPDRFEQLRKDYPLR